MTLRFACLVLLVSSTVAAAPRRKAKPDRFEQAASEAFERATAAEAAGDPRLAVELYLRAYELSPHANIAFNIAELMIARDLLTKAITYYEHYLALMPNATDRKEIEATIAELTTRPTTYEIKARPGEASAVDLAEAYVLIDGAIVRTPGKAGPLIVKLVPGLHTVEVVTAVTFSSKQIEVRPGVAPQTCYVQAPVKAGGNLVTSAEADLSVTVHGLERYQARRATVPAGSTRAAIEDRRCECPPITIDIPSGDDAVAYVHVAPRELRRLPQVGVDLPRCRQLAITQHALVFK